MIIKYKKIHEMCFCLIEGKKNLTPKKHGTTLNKSESAVQLTKHFNLYTLHTLAIGLAGSTQHTFTRKACPNLLVILFT